MFQCPTCGKELSVNAPICYNCGEVYVPGNPRYEGPGCSGFLMYIAVIICGYLIWAATLGR
jgi:zinc-ribbon domain